jgi:hypothetical protein
VAPGERRIRIEIEDRQGYRTVVKERKRLGRSEAGGGRLIAPSVKATHVMLFGWRGAAYTSSLHHFIKPARNSIPIDIN